MFSDLEAWHLKKDTELALTSFPEGRMAPQGLPSVSLSGTLCVPPVQLLGGVVTPPGLHAPRHPRGREAMRASALH